MLYTTLTFNGVELSLADLGISAPARSIQNQGDDSFSFTITMPTDGTSVFPYAAFILVQIGRVASSPNPNNATLPNSIEFTPDLTYSGGTKWFQGYCVFEKRIGQPGNEALQYKFVGPYKFFFDQTIFQKLHLSYNLVAEQMVPDWQSDCVLGLSLSPLTGGSDTVPGTTVTNLLTIAQQVKEIATFAKSGSTFQQANPTLYPYAAGIETWPEGAQFISDDLTSEINASGYDILKTPSSNVLISDYISFVVDGDNILKGAVPSGNLSTANALPNGVNQLRPPLDAVNGVTCKVALERMLQWLGGIGSPVVWTDHSTSPPTLHVATKQDLVNAGKVLNLAISADLRPDNIREMTELETNCVAFKYKQSNTINGAPQITVIHDIAAYINGTLYEGVGQLGSLLDLNGNPLSETIQAQLMAIALTPGAVVQTIDLQGSVVSVQSCKITCAPLALVNPAGNGSDGGFWGRLFPELVNTTGCSYSPSGAGLTITDTTTGTVYYQNNGWTAAANGGAGWAYMLTDGQIAPWMLSPAGTPKNPVAAKTVQVEVKLQFAYTQIITGPNGKYATPETVYCEEKTKKITLTTLASGTYTSQPSTIAGEPIPFGLAGYYCALESIPAFEGEININEQDITDQCPIGNVVNLTGGLSDWLTMNATVQAVNYNLETGETRVSIGPAKHLGPAQFVQRQRTNLGLRYFLLMNINPMGNATGQVTAGQNMPASDATSGGKVSTLISDLTSLGGQQGVAGNVATLPGGIHRDTGAGGCPFTGAVPTGVTPFIGQGTPSTSNNPGVVIAAGPGGGNPGESNAWIRLSINDLKNAQGVVQNVQIYLREVPICVNVGGTLTQMYQLFLCSAPYTTSIG